MKLTDDTAGKRVLRAWSRARFLILMTIVPLCLVTPARGAKFAHPGIYQTKADLDLMKQKVLAGEHPWKEAFERVKASVSLDDAIKVEQHIVRGAFNSPCIGADAFGRDANTAYQAALVWYISGEKLYAERAIAILNAWSPNVWDHFTLINFTHNGIYVSGAENVEMTGSNLSDNGSCIVPGPRLNHNFKLDHVQNVVVKDSRLAASPFGSGLSVIRCQNVAVTNCEIARNNWFGIHLAGSRDMTISGCLIEANSAAGIYAECLYDGCEQVTVSGNRIQYNDGYGLESYAGTNIKSSGNQYAGNGKPPKQEKISNERILLMTKD